MGVGEYISKTVAIDVLGDTYISGETAQNYLNAIELQYRQPVEDCMAVVRDENGPDYRGGGAKTYIHTIWGKFLALVMGQRGIFQKEGPRSKTRQTVDLCMELRPLGPPNQGDMWFCSTGRQKADYQKAIKLIFGATTPIPVSSRRYGENCVGTSCMSYR